MARRRSDGPDYRWQSFNGDISASVNTDSPSAALFGPEPGAPAEESLANLYSPSGTVHTSDATNFIRSIGKVALEQESSVASDRLVRMYWVLGWTENLTSLGFVDEQLDQPDTLEDVDVLAFGLESFTLRTDIGRFGDKSAEAIRFGWDVASTRVCEPMDAGLAFQYRVVDPSDSGISIAAHLSGRNLLRLD